MGVDFYTCAECQDTFPDCGYYFRCTNCENMFCSNACGRKVCKDGEVNKYQEDLTTCILCRKESVTDRDLLLFVLKKCNLTYDEAFEQYKVSDE